MSTLGPGPSNRDAPKRIVIYRLGSLGDTVVALPSLHSIARAFPDAERVMLTNIPVSAKAAPLQAILGGSDLVHRFLAYPVGLRSLDALWKLRVQLRALDARTLVYLTPARGRKAAWRDWLYFRLCGFNRVIGAPTSADLQHNRREADGTVEQECARLARCMAPLGAIDLSDPAGWDLHLQAAEIQSAATLLAPVGQAPRIAINMGGKVLANDWGEANWRALVEAMKQVCPEHALVFVGATEDAVRAGSVGAGWSGPVINLCGRVSPRVSAAAMQGSAFFVGHDSGPLHLAGSVGVTCIGLYGDKNEPRKWHPYGTQHRIIHDMRGVKAITVERVMEEIRAQLATPTGTGTETAEAPPAATGVATS